jgi:hypothetical protein
LAGRVSRRAATLSRGSAFRSSTKPGKEPARPISDRQQTVSGSAAGAGGWPAYRQRRQTRARQAGSRRRLEDAAPSAWKARGRASIGSRPRQLPSPGWTRRGRNGSRARENRRPSAARASETLPTLDRGQTEGAARALGPRRRQAALRARFPAAVPCSGKARRGSP